jgi:hypothetical protein
MAWFLTLLIGLAINIVAYLIMPKPKQPQPTETKDLDDPTAQAGRPLPVVFGSIRIQGLNVMWFGDKATVMRKLKSSGGKK